MTGIHVVENTLGDLANDLAGIARQAPKDMRATVKEGIKVGNSLAKDNARESAGSHGKLYHRAFSAEMHGGWSGGFGAYLISGEYGPDASKPQGNMEFEEGSRNQPAHDDLARSTDVIFPAFLGEVRRLPDRWMW